MDFGKAFTYMFEDPDWLRKLGIGTAIVLISIPLMVLLIGIIPLMIVFGYTIDVLRNVSRGDERPLPEWQDWGGFLSRGFKVVAATFIWSLPIFLLMIPLIIGSMLADQGQGQGGEAVGIVMILCGSCLLLLWALFVTLITPAIYIRIAETDEFFSAFAFGQIWQFTRDNLGNIIVALLLVYVVAALIAAIAGMLGLILLVVGVLITVPLATLWQYLVQAHLFGQIAKNSVTPI